MKYKIAVCVVAILAAILIGDGFRHSKRAEQKASAVRDAVLALSPEQLAAVGAKCDAQRPGERPSYAASYCQEVSRRLDDQPLQIVDLDRKP